QIAYRPNVRDRTQKSRHENSSLWTTLERLKPRLFIIGLLTEGPEIPHPFSDTRPSLLGSLRH
ncbi:cyclic nucleotide-gated cation channel beta-1, partial [Biomphalaria glabrata]